MTRKERIQGGILFFIAAMIIAAILPRAFIQHTKALTSDRDLPTANTNPSEISKSPLPTYVYLSQVYDSVQALLVRLAAGDSTHTTVWPYQIEGLLFQLYQRGIIDVPDSLRAFSRIQLVRDGSVVKGHIDSFYLYRHAVGLVKLWFQTNTTAEKEEISRWYRALIRPNIVLDTVLSRPFLHYVHANGHKSTQVRISADDGRSPVLQDVVKEPQGWWDRLRQNTWVRLLGYVFLTLSLFLILALYIYFNFPQIYHNWRELAFILLWFVLFGYLVTVVERVPQIDIYLLPFAIVPIVVKNFYETRLAIVVHVLLILMASYLTSLGYEFTYTEILMGFIAVLTPTETRHWSSFFKLVFYVTLTGLVTHIVLSIVGSETTAKSEVQRVFSFILQGILLLLAYPLIPLVERIFGYTSSITLVDLYDLNHPLIRELSLRAPGTLQHSLQVGHLAELAAEAIGANALLVKVGALYHDIGKVKNPEYFIENQQEGNPHEAVDPLESAKKIIEHVTEGVRMAKQAGLPKIIRDFITTHHGTTLVEYFYRKALEQNPNDPTLEMAFRYPGPRPRTKEQVLLMIADSAEAASRSLDKPDAQSISNLVDSILQKKMEDEHFFYNDTTTPELYTAVDVIKRTLTNIYHVRLKYPGQPSENP